MGDDVLNRLRKIEDEGSDTSAFLVSAVVDRFAEAVSRMQAETSESNAHQVAVAGRVAWATLYNILQIVGNLPGDAERRFRRELAYSFELMRTVRSSARVDSYARQIAWYRRLLELYREGGVASVNEEIERRFLACPQTRCTTD